MLQFDVWLHCKVSNFFRSTDPLKIVYSLKEAHFTSEGFT